MRKVLLAVLAVAVLPLRAAAQPQPQQPDTSHVNAPPDLRQPESAPLPPPAEPGETPVAQPQPEPEPVPVPEPAPVVVVQESATEAATLPSEGGSRFLPAGRWFDRLESSDPIFEIRHDPFTLAFHGLLQVQFAPFVQDDARRSNGDAADALGFVLRRARLGLDGELVGGVTYALQYEFFDGSIDGEGGSRLLDANIGYTRYPLANLTFGAQKVPFSKTQITSAANLQFVERPFSTRQIATFPPLVPDRQLGAVISGDLIGAGEYAVGVFNGNSTLFRGDDNGGLLYVARLELHPLGTTGDSQAAFHPDDDGYRHVRAALGGDIYFDDDAAGDQLAWSIDLTAKWRNLSVMVEYLQGHFEPASDPVRPPELAGELDQRAFFAQAGYFLLPGRLELAARFEVWDTNTEDEDPTDLQAYTAALNLYMLRDRIKAQIQFTHRREPNSDGDLENDTGVLALQAKF